MVTQPTAASPAVAAVDQAGTDLKHSKLFSPAAASASVGRDASACTAEAHGPSTKQECMKRPAAAEKPPTIEAPAAAAQSKPSRKKQRRVGASSSSRSKAAAADEEAAPSDRDQRAVHQPGIQEAAASSAPSVEPEWASPKVRKARAAAAQAAAAVGPASGPAHPAGQGHSSHGAGNAMQLNPADPEALLASFQTSAAASNLAHAQPEHNDMSMKAEQAPSDQNAFMSATEIAPTASPALTTEQPPARDTDFPTGGHVPGATAPIPLAKSGPGSEVTSLGAAQGGIRTSKSQKETPSHHAPAANASLTSGGFGSLISIDEPRSMAKGKLRTHFSDTRNRPCVSVPDKVPAAVPSGLAAGASLAAQHALQAAAGSANVGQAAAGGTSIPGGTAGSTAVRQAGMQAIAFPEAAATSAAAPADVPEAAHPTTAMAESQLGDGTLPPHILMKRPSRSGGTSPATRPVALMDSLLQKPSLVPAASQPALSVPQQHIATQPSGAALQIGSTGHEHKDHAAAPADAAVINADGVGQSAAGCHQLQGQPEEALSTVSPFGIQKSEVRVQHRHPSHDSTVPAIGTKRHRLDESGGQLVSNRSDRSSPYGDKQGVQAAKKSLGASSDVANQRKPYPLADQGLTPSQIAKAADSSPTKKSCGISRPVALSDVQPARRESGAQHDLPAGKQNAGAGPHGKKPSGAAKSRLSDGAHRPGVAVTLSLSAKLKPGEDSLHGAASL